MQRVVRARSHSAASESARVIARDSTGNRCVFGDGGHVGSRKLAGNGDRTRYRSSMAIPGSATSPCAARSSFSGSTTRPLWDQRPACKARTVACGSLRRSAATAGPKSISSGARTSGDQSAHTARIESARSRAIRPAKVVRIARASRSASTARSGVRSSPTEARPSRGKCREARRLDRLDLPSCPANATMCPARSAARATGTSGRMPCPAGEREK